MTFLLTLLSAWIRYKIPLTIIVTYSVHVITDN